MHKVEKINPEINKVYLIERHTLIHVISGKGGIQVDFKNYFDWQEKAIFLEKGQYIKFLADDFTVRWINFSSVDKFKNSEVRVLFKHLISLGYIDLLECTECSSFLSESILTQSSADIIDISSKQWYWQNPFNANKEEYQVIFDAKEIIDAEFSNNLTSDDLVNLIKDRGYNAQALIKDKVGLSVKNLMNSKRIQEGLKEVAMSDKSIQEVSYDLGYKDDAYFNRVFKKSTGQTPRQFRENFDFENRDKFVLNIMELLKKYHTEERSIGFYANKMNVSIKVLSQKVHNKMNVTLGQLIRLELINSSKLMLIEGAKVTDAAIRMGFDEPNHFSRFFKHYTGITPSEFIAKKHNL